MKEKLKITCTHGNSKNLISGSRITIYANSKIVDRFEVTSRYGVSYCKNYPNGKYGKRYFAALKKAEENS
jgi:hypothetical protein